MPVYGDDSSDVVSYVDGLIKYYGSRATKYGRALWTYKVLALTSSVGVTVLSGIQAVSGNYPWLITIVAGSATLFNGMLAATKAQEFYLQAATQHAKVSSEKILFLGGAGAYASETSREGRLKVLAERVQTINLHGIQEVRELNVRELKQRQSSKTE